MQKRIFTFLFLLFTFLSYSTFAEAALQFLPRYQGGYGSRTQTGGKDKVCKAIYQYSCSGTGYAGGIGESCNDLYTSCSCSANYKWSGGSCTLKTCADYGYSASKDTTKSCEEKTPRSGLTCYVCKSCNTTTYKYSCSGGLNATNQSGPACNSLYSECACVEHASWNASSGKCECGSDYKAGSTSCSLKTCDDYGYSATEDKTKNCSKQTPRSGLECWSCTACTGTLYDCGSITNASGGEGTACGGKYPKCKCKTGYFWDNGKCSLSCSPFNCNNGTNCKDENGIAAACTMAGSVSEGVAAFSSCTSNNCSSENYKSGFRATGCNTDKDGWILVNGLCTCNAGTDYIQTASECENASCNLGCNDKYKFNQCNDGYAGYAIGNCSVPETTDCAALGYTSTGCAGGETALRCPFGNAVFCISTTK